MTARSSHEINTDQHIVRLHNTVTSLEAQLERLQHQMVDVQAGSEPEREALLNLVTTVRVSNAHLEAIRRDQAATHIRLNALEESIGRRNLPPSG